MKAFLLAILSISACVSNAQYYYKDILGTRESSDMIGIYMKNRVGRVVISSFNGENQKDSEFYVEQQFTPNTRTMRTVSRSGMTNESVLSSVVDDKGRVVMTIDSSDMVISKTQYEYNGAGQLVLVTSSSTDTAQSSIESEQHLWYWGTSGQPSRMLRVKNRKDTIYVNFKFDENGRISEETETRRGSISQPVYYYYNDKGQLSDIVRFNKKANRLLPEYMFEYTDKGQVKQKITVPANSSDYMIWVYQYNEQGLKTKEAIFNKHDKRKALGRVVYEYSFL